MVITSPEGYVALSAKVCLVVDAINNNKIVPYADFGGPFVYWFQTSSNGLGSIIYTIFDKETTLGLESFLVSYGNATIIQQIIFSQYNKSKIETQFLLLPIIPAKNNNNGTVIS